MLVAISPEGRDKDKLRMMGSGSVRVTGQAVGGCNGTRRKVITRTYARSWARASTRYQRAQAHNYAGAVRQMEAGVRQWHGLARRSAGQR